jgi:hypothetical protein
MSIKEIGIMNNKKSIGIRIEGSEVHLEGNHIEGFDEGVYASGGSKVTALNNTIKGMSDDELDQLKNALLSEIEGLIAEAKKGNDHKLNLLTNFLGGVGSSAFISYLKSKGLLI